MISAIIIDDDHLARAELKRLLQEHNDLEVVGVPPDTIAQGVEQINAHEPDVVFLDIQMLENAGFSQLSDVRKMPRLVCLATTDKYGLKAFEINAFDYILKPVVLKRLSCIMDKIRDCIDKEHVAQNRLPHKVSLTDTDHVFVKDGEQCWFLKLAEVRLFESTGNYTKIYFGDNKPLILKSLNALEEKLDCRVFFRANRKNIINLRWVKNIEPYFNGGLLLELKGGEKVEISRRQTVKFKETMSL